MSRNDFVINLSDDEQSQKLPDNKGVWDVSIIKIATNTDIVNTDDKSAISESSNIISTDPISEQASQVVINSSDFQMSSEDDIQIPVAQVQIVETQQVNDQSNNDIPSETWKEKTFRDFAKKDDTESLKVLQQIAQSWIKMEEDVDQQVSLEIFSNIHKKQKQRKTLLRLVYSIIFVLIFWASWFFIYINNSFFASIIEWWFWDIVFDWKVSTIAEKIWNNPSSLPFVDKWKINSSDIALFYDFYKSDYSFISNSWLDAEEKKKILIKIHLLIQELNKWNISYINFRIKYNTIINSAFSDIKDLEK